MSQTMAKDGKIMALSFVVAATTVIAGIMHIQLAPMQLSRDLGEGMPPTRKSMLQVFWALPVVKQWGRIWQIIGIVGTIVFTVLWFATHMHNFVGGAPGGSMPGGGPTGNMSQGPVQGSVTGGHFPRGSPPRGIASLPQLEYFQFAFIGLYMALGVALSKRRRVAIAASGEEKK
ncbi:MAG: hypothetical protein KGH88_05860 [Thaumarchaeota archaeon]|nr:hypothetical protein [Nitrososphaerota archaeon]